MFTPRTIESDPAWQDADGIKLYTISAHARAVDRHLFEDRLQQVKAARHIDWANTPAFAILHDGAGCLYLILAWWGNDNELFTSVSVLTSDGWMEDPARYSFCLFDLEVFWAERNFFIEHLYCSTPDIDRYRQARL
ncbi:MAG: hypothetical protein WBJ03_12490 [Moraxellaceae bacterium]